MRTSVSKRLFLWVLVACWAISAPVIAQDLAVIDRALLEAEIDGRVVAFLARDLRSGREYRLQDSDTATRHTPWSTFKIPNLLVGLDTDVAPSLDAARAWDPVRRPARSWWPQAWRQDQTLRSAFQRSAVWYFRDLALEIGTGRYRDLLARWSYGNAEIPDGSDAFWLDGSLKISVEEQVAFLGALASGTLDVSPRAVAALMRVSAAGEVDGVSLHGKTGSGTERAGDFSGGFEGWYVGLVHRADAKPVVFALHVQAKSYDRLKNFRKAFAVRLLQQIGVLPEGFPTR